MGAYPEGRYSGTLTGGYDLDLRLSLGADGVFDYASGDVARGGAHLFSFDLRPGDARGLPLGGFEGRVKIYGSVAPFGEIRVIPPPDGGGAALTVVLKLGTSQQHGRVDRVGASLRRVRVDIDRLRDAPPIDPDLCLAPPDARSLRGALALAGVDADVRLHAPEAVASPERISLAELHQRLEAYWSRYADTAFPMRLHMLLCNRLAGTPGESTVGIMYDAGGASTAQRRGAAVFLGHPSIDGLPADSAERADETIFAMVHEIGHAMNLPDAWLRPSGAEELTWMNYPHRYPGGAASFRSAFAARRCFHETELRFLHHAPFADIVPGQGRFGQRQSDLLSGQGGGALMADEPPGSPTFHIAPLKPRYLFGEPIFLRLSVRNDGPGPLAVARALDPSDGYLDLAIHRPDGGEVAFRSPATLCGRPRMRMLKPGQSVDFDGVLLSHSGDGFLFDRPGAYRIEAAFHGVPGRTLHASTGLRVLYPTRSEELFALALWEDERLSRTVWLRHPLVDREGWNGLTEDGGGSIPSDPGNTTRSYLAYVAALGWMAPHTDADGTYNAPDRRKARERLGAVDPSGLPGGVRRRMRSLRLAR